MAYIPKERDFELLYQPDIVLNFKAEILNSNGTVLDVLNGIISGGSSDIDSTSDVRRTASITLVPTDDQSTNIAENSLIWINKDIHLYIGIQDLLTGEPVLFSQGYYVFTDTSNSYNSTTNELTVNCNDWTAKLDGSKNGTMGQLTTILPAYSIEISDMWISKYTTSNSEATWDEIFELIKQDYAPAWINFSEENIALLKDLFNEIFNNYDKEKINEQVESIRKIYKQENSIGYIDYDDVKFDDEHYLTIMKHNIIKDALNQIASQLVGLTPDKIMIDDIGEYLAMSQYNENYETYRKENPLWNSIPYDLEFECGDTKLDMITEIRDLYPNYEAFFDIDNVFTCQMIPSCNSDPVLINNDVLQSLLISEDLSFDLTEVKNICEIWGQVFDTDFYTEDVTLSENCYELAIKFYEEEYFTGDIVSFLCPTTHSGETTIKINSLDEVTLYDENTDKPYEEELLEGTCYTLKIKKSYIDKEYITKAYVQGTYQVHAMSVLSNGTCTEEIVTPNGNTVIKYSKEYFQELYNCKNVNIQIIKDSPFAVEKVGELLFVGEGNDYENIISDSLCLARCDYELYKHARLTDSIGLEILICPFLDVNIKVSYKRSDEEEHQYIIQQISHNFDSGTTSLTLTRFYELYETI